MMDYFDANAVNGTAASGADAAAGGALQPAASNGGEDLGMDEISVSISLISIWSCH
jgi:hypothetical protein